MFQILQKILMRHQRMKLTKIFSGFWKLAWTRFNKSAMWFQSFTDMENINCYQFSNINILYINNAVCSAFFGHLILHFALPPRIYSFGQNTTYWWFEGVLVFDSCFFCFVFCLGIFGVCMCMYACGYVCIQWRANWKTVLFILLLTPVEIKQIFTFVTFYFFLMMHRVSMMQVSILDFKSEEILPLEVWF